MPETVLDLSETETAEDAARALAEYLRDFEEETGGHADEVRLFEPAEVQSHYDYDRDDMYLVSWEAGPPEWALALTGGESMLSREFPEFGPGEPQVVGFHDNDSWSVEHHYSFDVLFIPEYTP